MRNKGMASAIGFALALGACAPTYQFTGALRYDNLMARPAAERASADARRQLLDRAAVHGLEPVSTDDDLLVYRMQAPSYVVTLDDGTTEERVDPRVVRVEARLDNRLGRGVYRYYCWVEGDEPAVFSDEDRARFGLALLAVREIFETPIRTDLLGGE